jgi:hypothetical protein
VPKFNAFFIIVSLGCILVSGCQSTDDSGSADTVSTAHSDLAVIELQGRDSVSVLDLLLEAHRVDYRQSSVGAFVSAIDSLEAEGQTYWIFRVNDSTPPIACDKLITRAGDKVTWHLRTP